MRYPPPMRFHFKLHGNSLNLYPIFLGKRLTNQYQYDDWLATKYDYMAPSLVSKKCLCHQRRGIRFKSVLFTDFAINLQCTFIAKR